MKPLQPLRFVPVDETYIAKCASVIDKLVMAREVIDEMNRQRNAFRIPRYLPGSVQAGAIKVMVHESVKPGTVIILDSIYTKPADDPDYKHQQDIENFYNTVREMTKHLD